MGAFFTNVQVHTGSLSAADARGAVLAAVRAWIEKQGFIEMGAAEVAMHQMADRTVLVGPVSDRPWLAVYDEASEDQDEAIVRTLAEQLSLIAGTAVGVLDHDSDVLHLWLCRDGALVDQFDSHPNYFAGALPGSPLLAGDELEEVAGHPERWRDLLVGGASPGQLRAIWDRKVVIAEEMLVEIASVLGWDRALSAVGFTYLDRGEEPFDPDTFTRLTFRAATSPRADFRGSGLPALVQAGGLREFRTAVGRPFSGVGVTFQNSGGPGLGMGVVLWGPALELLDMREIGVVTRSDLAGAAPDVLAIPLVRTVSKDASIPMLYAELPDLPIPVGFANPVAGVPGAMGLPQRGITMRRMFDLQAAAWLAFTLSGTGAKIGEAELNIGAVPLQNREEGQTSWTLNVIVSESA